MSKKVISNDNDVATPEKDNTQDQPNETQLEQNEKDTSKVGDNNPVEDKNTPNVGPANGVKLSPEETSELENTNQKRHGVSPTVGNIVEGERVDADLPVEHPGTLETNGRTNEQEFSDKEKEDLEKKLSKDNIVARVITWSGKYLKVKFFRDNKPFAVYKGKDGSVEDAAKVRDEAAKASDEVKS